MKKIVIITNSSWSLLTFRKELILHLVRRHYVVYGLANDFTEATKRKMESLGAIPVDYPMSRGGLNPFTEYINMLRLSRILKQIAPDVVFSTIVKPVIFGTLAAQRAGVVRTIGMLEGLGYYFTEQPEGQTLKSYLIKKIQVWLYKLAIPKLDYLVFLNHDDPKDLLEKHSIKVKAYKVLGGIGVSLTDYKFSNCSVNPVVFIFVGRLLKEKGILEYLKAAEIIKKRYPEVVFLVLGDVDTDNPGSFTQNYLNKFVQNGIINYKGYMEDIRPWLINSGIMVLPSYREGIPFSIQEAQAIGRAIITTYAPGCRETVIDGYNGFLVKRWNIDELVEKMEYFIQNPIEMMRMGKNANTFANKHYNVESKNIELEKIILGD